MLKVKKGDVIRVKGDPTDYTQDLNLIPLTVIDISEENGIVRVVEDFYGEPLHWYIKMENIMEVLNGQSLS